ncbi:Yip1 family protein [Streptomyces harbinensis]|uniref:Yip1 family protein n=1 Tax=Streptomyces harbinensis TaxID=1176198 RepID=UPI0037119343
MPGQRRKREQEPQQPYPSPYQAEPYYDDGHGDGYGHGHGYGTPAAAGPAEPPPPPPQPPLPWKELLPSLILKPDPTFWRMRDYPMWGPALIVTFLYGTVAVFGLDKAREDILNTTVSNAVIYLLITGVAMVLGSLLLSTVTHNLARQFGGNGLWAPTTGLAMLIMALTDVPRLLVAIFVGGATPVVQILGWATWLFAGALFTMMVARSHELPWPRALAASAIQLLSLLMLVKLGTL